MPTSLQRAARTAAGTSAILAMSQALAAPAEPATFADLRAAALAAMHTENLTTLEFTASGWEGCLGQPWRIAEGWARWQLTDYRRVLDYAAGTSLQTAQRRAGLDPDKLGGCGAQPGAQATPQTSSITPASSWTNQLPLWLTPHGFLELAARNAPELSREDGGWRISFGVARDGVSYPFEGHFDKDALLQRVTTRLDDSVYGDMLMEAEFSDYRDFDGLLFPAHLVQKQGGFAVLDLDVNAVTPNTNAPSTVPARQGGAAQAQADSGEPVTEVAPGIFVSNGAYQSVIVDTEAGIVVIDGLQNDARSAEIIAHAKEAIPGKPIRYVISTHNHFDHAYGLRAFLAEGATLLTHASNVEFFAAALANPRTLSGAPQPEFTVSVQGVGDTFTLNDPVNEIQLHRVRGSVHADDMLVAYLPALNAVVEADLLQPWINPVFGGGREGPHPYLVHLADELTRLDLPYTRFIPIHRPSQPPFMSKDDLLRAIGANQ